MDLGSATNLLSLLGDPTRVRLVALLAREELSVAELVEAIGVAQSRVSTHLGRLREGGLVRDRKEGTSAFYSLAESAMPEPARKVLELVRGEVKDATLDADARRAAAIVKRRRTGLGWPESVAGSMERHYSPGRTWESMTRGILGLVSAGDVLDVGCGDGTVAALIAARSRSVTCLDRSLRMLEAAKERLAGAPNVRFESGDLHALPMADESFDVVLLFHVLTCADDPARALAEAARVLRPGGSVAVLALDHHDAAELTGSYGHVHPGFRPRKLGSMLAAAGLMVEHCEVTSRERREPFFQVVSASARKPGAPASRSSSSRAPSSRRQPSSRSQSR
ncbi:MAG: metalloregulator ArsR/SmtB family transcription factor [Myxococcota bacterium]|nr:metalloregulator ArsR/SmtB family transcription factor [Myxococcota bacterium]